MKKFHAFWNFTTFFSNMLAILDFFFYIWKECSQHMQKSQMFWKFIFEPIFSFTWYLFFWNDLQIFVPKYEEITNVLKTNRKSSNVFESVHTFRSVSKISENNPTEIWRNRMCFEIAGIDVWKKVIISDPFRNFLEIIRSKYEEITRVLKFQGSFSNVVETFEFFWSVLKQSEKQPKYEELPHVLKFHETIFSKIFTTEIFSFQQFPSLRGHFSTTEERSTDLCEISCGGRPNVYGSEKKIPYREPIVVFFIWSTAQALRYLSMILFIVFVCFIEGCDVDVWFSAFYWGLWCKCVIRFVLPRSLHCDKKLN